MSSAALTEDRGLRGRVTAPPRRERSNVWPRGVVGRWRSVGHSHIDDDTQIVPEPNRAQP